MIIREARKEDYQAAVTLYGEFNSSIRVADGQDRFAQWQAILDHPGTTVFSAELDGGIIAIATLHILPNMTHGGRPYALVENVITAREHRGKGAGRQVMEKVIESAKAADVYKIMLLTGKYRKDRGVRGFYEKLGFSADEKFGLTIRQDH